MQPERESPRPRRQAPPQDRPRADRTTPPFPNKGTRGPELKLTRVCHPQLQGPDLVGSPAWSFWPSSSIPARNLDPLSKSSRWHHCPPPPISARTRPSRSAERTLTLRKTLTPRSLSSLMLATPLLTPCRPAPLASFSKADSTHTRRVRPFPKWHPAQQGKAQISML